MENKPKHNDPKNLGKLLKAYTAYRETSPQNTPFPTDTHTYTATKMYLQSILFEPPKMNAALVALNNKKKKMFFFFLEN